MMEFGNISFVTFFVKPLHGVARAFFFFHSFPPIKHTIIRWPILPTKTRRRYTHLLPEIKAKRTHAVITATLGYLRQRQRGFRQIFFCLQNPVLNNKLIQSKPRQQAYRVTQLNKINSQPIRQHRTVTNIRILQFSHHSIQNNRTRRTNNSAFKTVTYSSSTVNCRILQTRSSLISPHFRLCLWKILLPIQKNTFFSRKPAKFYSFFRINRNIKSDSTFIF